MSASVTGSRKQLGVGLGMGVALAITVAAFVWPRSPTLAVSDRGRIWLAACALVSAFWLALAVALLASHRFFSPQDIDGAGLTEATARARLLQALVQNTLEQTVLGALAWGAWLALAPAASVGLAAVCAALFFVGRLAFFAGYGRGAAARALGFGLTFYPTVGLIALCLPRAALLLIGMLWSG